MNNIIFLKDNEIVFGNGAYALAYKLTLPEKYSLGEQDYLSLNENWVKGLKSLPTSTIFCKQDVFLKSTVNTEDFRDNNFLESATKKHFQGKECLNNHCYLFFIKSSQNLISENLTNPFKKLVKNNFDEFDEDIEKLRNSVFETVSFLNSIKLQGGNKLSIIPFEEKELNNYYNLYFNLFNDTYISDRFFDEDFVKIGDNYAGVVALVDENNFSDNLNQRIKDKDLSNDLTVFYQNYGEKFSFNLDFSHIYTQIAVIQDTRVELDKLRKVNDQLKKSSSFDKQNLHFAGVTDGIITDIVDNLDTIKLIRGHNNIIVIDDNPELLKKNVLKVAEQFKDIDTKSYIPKGNYLNAIFNYTFPFFNQYFTEKQLYLTSLDVFCSFINNTGNYHNDNKGVLYNSRLYNNPVYVDTWDEKKKNINARNFFILAPTGFGKSFNANHIISTYYSLGNKIVIVDLGGSYRKLASLFPDDISYITYQQGKSLGVNPFEIKNIDTDKIEELVEFVGVHYKRDSELSEIEKTSLRKIIEKYYELNEYEDYCLPHFVNFIKRKRSLLEDLNIKSEFFNVDEFLHLMSEFIDNGTYSFLYQKTEFLLGENIKDKKIIVFELDKARENQLLLTVMLQLVFSTINKIIWNDKSTKGIVLFDEVAEQLQWNGVLKRIQYFFQAIRKQNGAVGIILQSESQLPEHPLSKAIIENTQILYVLNAKDYKKLQQRFNLSEHAYYQMVSLQSNFSAERPYSEIFIMRGNKHQVYRLEVPKEVFWAYQTEGEQNEKLISLANEIGIENAIKEFINQ